MSEGVQVLLVEDSSDDIDIVTRELKKAYPNIKIHAVDTAQSLSEALHKQSWDIVIADYRMPNFSGMAALQLVRQAQPALPFLLVSGTIGDEKAVAALTAGVDDYVLKGSLARLPSAVQRQLDITADRVARREADQALRESEERFRQMAEHIRDVIFLSEPQHNSMLYVSPAYEEVWGRSLASLYADPQSWAKAIHPDDKDRMAALVTEIVKTGRYDCEYRIIRPDGSIRWIHSRGYPIFDQAGHIYRMAGISADVSESKRAEERIRRQSRVHSLMSGINAVIARVTQRDDLFREACRIAVEAGHLRMAWLGIYDAKTASVVPVAWHGHENDFLRLVALQASDPVKEGRGLVRRVIREARPVIINDIENDDRFRLRQDALERGYRSCGIFPLTNGGKVIGVLGLFAGESKFFDEDEVRLLNQLTGDISYALDHIQKSEKLDYLAYYDGLTGLANRTLLLERLQQSIHAARENHTRIALVVCDLQRFRAVNESLGRQAGDQVLTQFSERMQKTIADTQISRIGSDHFAIVLPGVTDGLDASRMLGKLEKACLREPFKIGDEELRMSARAGVSLFPNDGADAETLLRNAEAALQRCKKAGQPHLFFEPAMTERVSEKLTLESRLRLAIEREEFVLFYQPKIDAATRKIVGVEALIRWETEEGLIPPGRFIPLLEETGLILQVGAWALRRAVLQHRAWVDQGIPAPRIAVNVSAVQLQQRDFVSTVKRAIEQGTVTPGVDLEITESMIMDDVAGSIEKLRAVRDLGLNVAIDDFGTGYSSLAYLAKLPVGFLKIDRSFIITMLGDPSAMSVVSAIVSLAHTLKLKVVAEGVDREDQAAALRLLGCDEFQGYLYSKPLPNEQVVKLLHSGGN
jgi:diguanylate cyclase (GGDEF)-like protein/PAS domain S-box-containing protein